MAAFVTCDEQGRCISLSHDARLMNDDLWHAIPCSRAAAISEGTIPLHSALDLWPHATVPGHPNIHLMGHRADMPFWTKICGMIDASLLRTCQIAIWDWRPNKDSLHLHFPYHRLSEVFSGYKRKLLIIDGRSECMNPLRHMAELFQRLREWGLSKHEIVHITGNQTASERCTTIITRYMMCSDWYEWKTQPREGALSHFVMLARHARPLRVAAAVEVLRRGLDAKGSISCGVYSDRDGRLLDRMVPADLRTRFPLHLDADIVDDDLQYDCDDPRISAAAINCICETSQDPDIADGIWSDIFQTEKTSKAFLLCQLPIWITVPGSVADVRSLGFDVFDDVIDHSYDDVVDPMGRVKMAIDQLESLCQMDLTALDDLRRSLWPRLMANKLLLEGMHGPIRHGIAQGVQELVAGTDPAIDRSI